MDTIIIGLSFLNIHDPCSLLIDIKDSQCLSTFLDKREAYLDGQNSYSEYVWFLNKIKLLSLIKICVVREIETFPCLLMNVM